jgi:chorismate mutase/prephenate dehydratase
VAPVENSTEGGVGTTLDRFLQSPLRVAGEIYLKVSHALMSKETDLSRVDRVFSHPQALGQCLDWLSRRLPAGKMVATSSTSAAAARAAAEPDTAAVGGELLAELHGLNILARDIQDRSINLTRFLVIGTDDCPATGRDKTSVWFAARHKPGALYGCLKAFSDLGVNMTRIESRPSQAGQGPWEYVFFLDVEGHREDEAVRTALEELRKSADRLRVLGSYPMANPDGSEALGAAPWNLSS